MIGLEGQPLHPALVTFLQQFLPHGAVVEGTLETTVYYTVGGRPCEADLGVFTTRSF